MRLHQQIPVSLTTVAEGLALHLDVAQPEQGLVPQCWLWLANTLTAAAKHVLQQQVWSSFKRDCTFVTATAQQRPVKHSLQEPCPVASLFKMRAVVCKYMLRLCKLRCFALFGIHRTDGTAPVAAVCCSILTKETPNPTEFYSFWRMAFAVKLHPTVKSYVVNKRLQVSAS